MFKVCFGRAWKIDPWGLISPRMFLDLGMKGGDLADMFQGPQT